MSKKLSKLKTTREYPMRFGTNNKTSLADVVVVSRRDDEEEEEVVVAAMVDGGGDGGGDDGGGGPRLWCSVPSDGELLSLISDR